MKLRKAIEKARLTKMPTQRRMPKRPVPVDHKVRNNEWKPPVYSDSTRVQLDPECLLDNRCICISPDAPELESYKVLRTKIQQLTKEKGWNTVMVTSAEAGEGKTSMRSVQKAVEAIPKEKFLGFVMNKQKTGSSQYRSYPSR